MTNNTYGTTEIVQDASAAVETLSACVDALKRETTDPAQAELVETTSVALDQIKAALERYVAVRLAA